MSLKDLEKKAVEIIVRGDPHKIVQILGSVESVSGFNRPQEFLHIVLDPKTSTPEKIGLLKFQGTSPVRGGDRIKVGLILDEYFEKHGVGNILYLDVLKQNGSFGRRDFMDGYNPMQKDIEKLGLV